ncbi:MAG: hypothetical protein M3301_04215, partial [Chloroflexota bacterium]|nr:hypothetical protein [Chloroflexota bacterium]
MAVRLHLKIGLVAERDRPESSPDTTLVTEPSVGSTSRSKGSLYVVVTAGAGSGGRAHEATGVVADTIRREYYYDESAGIPICLQKALRSANRRLRHGREGHGLAAGSIGAVVAVVRGYELYVASTGDAEAYLVRQARLLTLPAEDRGEGLPTAEDIRVGVWRGEIAVGDSLILVSGNLTRTVGTDELKNAVVTLHPQSAVEHLHHLFVAGGGSRSDAILALEATEVAATRTERTLVPVRAPEPLAGAPERSPIPLADPLVAAASAVQGRAREARQAAGGALSGLVDRVTELLPRRGMRYRQIAPQSSRREGQQRAAIAFLSLLLFVALVMVVLWVFSGLRRDDQISPVIAGENAFAGAQQRLNEAMPNGQLAAGDREHTLRLLREAWGQLRSAERAGVPETRLRPLRTRAAAGLERLYSVRHSAARLAFAFTKVSRQPDMADLVRGPDGASYTIDRVRRSVFRVDAAGRGAVEVVTVGDGPGT